MSFYVSPDLPLETTLAREVASSASDLQGLNFESCVWRAVSSHSSHNPQEVHLAQFSLYVHDSGLKPNSFYFYLGPVAATSRIVYNMRISVYCGQIRDVAHTSQHFQLTNLKFNVAVNSTEVIFYK